jgi:hypothetical protein
MTSTLRVLLAVACAPGVFAAGKKELPLYFFPTDSNASSYAVAGDPASPRISANHIDFGGDMRRIELVKARSGASSLPEDPVNRLSVFAGSDPGLWRTRLPLYHRIRYESIYPGIDILYYGNAQRLEYDFEIAPGADPSWIRLRFPRGAALELSSNGDLQVSLGNSIIKQARPHAYQGSRTVPADYVIDRRHREVRIALGAYDRSQRLTIDPVLAYGAAAARGSDGAVAIAVDPAGNAYVLADSGSISGGNTTKFGPADVSRDVMLLKIDPTGGQLLYAVMLGGARGESPGGVAIDRDGNAYVTGTTYSADFPVTSHALLTSMPSLIGTSAFVTKISPDGTSLVYSTFLGGSGSSIGSAIAVDRYGNAFVTGTLSRPDFPLTAGAYQSTFGRYPLGSAYALGPIAGGFVTKIDTTGSVLLYSSLLDVSASAITIDEAGAAYVAGHTLPNLLPSTQYAFEAANNKSDGTIITKMNPSGASADFTTFVPCVTSVFGSAGLIALDSMHNIILAGSSSCTSFPATSKAFQGQHATLAPGINSEEAKYDGLIVKIASDGSSLLAATFLGGSKLDVINGVRVASDDSILVTGTTASSEFPVTADALQPSYAGGGILSVPYGDGFFSRLSPNLDQLLYSTYLGGSSFDYMTALALDIADNAYLAGSTNSSNSPRTANVFSFGNPGAVWALKLGNDTRQSPILSSLSPGYATAGTGDLTIQLTGANFAADAILLVNGSPCATMFNSDGQLTAIIAAADLALTGRLELRVLNPKSAASNSVFLPVNPADGVNAYPRIAAVLPSGMSAGSAGQNITVRGSGFLPSTVASIDGNPRTTVAAGDNELSVFLTSDDFASARISDLTLANPAPGGGVSSPVRFQVSALVPTKAPSLSGIQPTLLPAGTSSTEIAIFAARMTRAMVARWNGVEHPISVDYTGRATFIASAADLAHAGTAEVTLYDPATGFESNPIPFWMPLPIPGSDLAYSSFTKRLYLSSSGTNSITIINPDTGDAETTFPLDTAAGRLDVSSNGEYLFVALAARAELRRYTLLPAAPWLSSRLDLPVKTVLNFAPVPGTSGAVAVTFGSPSQYQVAIYDNAVARTSIARLTTYPTGSMQFSEDGRMLYFAAGYSTLAVTAMPITDSGVGSAVTRGVAGDNSAPVRYFRGRFYSSSGNVFDAATLNRVGRVPVTSYAPPLASEQAIIMLATSSQFYCSLQAFDPQTFAPLWETRAGSGCAANYDRYSNLFDAGEGRIAFRMTSIYIVKQPSPAPLHSITTPEPVFKRTFELGTAWDPENQLVILSDQDTVPITAFISSTQNVFSLGPAYYNAEFFVHWTPGAYGFAKANVPLPAGQYTGAVSVLLSNTTNGPLVVPYEISVINTYPLRASVNSLAFTYKIGDKPPDPQSFTLTKDGKPMTAGFKGFPYPGWLTYLNSDNGVPETITIGIKPASLAPGTYTATIMFGYYSTSDFDIAIPVTLQVLPQ